MMTKTNLWRPILTVHALLLAPLAFSQVSCTQLECGVGTTEKDGQCVLPDDARPESPLYCADGTHYDDVARGCISDLPPTVCEEGTTNPVTREDGVIVCEGAGGGGCMALPCPNPAPGKITVCGWLKDAQNDDLIGGLDQDGELCGDTPTTSGPCSIEVQFYDALMFAGDPTGTPAIEPDSIRVNNCGRFVATNLTAPALGFLAIGVDDYEVPATQPDNYFLGGVVIASMAGLRVTDLDVYAVRNSSDQDWTTSANQPFGTASFGDRGAYLPIFTHKDTPVAGVVVTENGSPQPTDDYYFSDTDPTERTTIDVNQTSTGANGSALLVDSGLVNHSGQGSEDMLEGCVWPSTLADAIPDVYFVQARESQDALGNVCE